jgi:hypothetical protein
LTPEERKKYFGEVEEMYNKEPKITAEQLLSECRLHGTDKEAEKVIAEKYGLSQLTIRTYIHDKGIKEILKVEQVAPAKVEETKPEESEKLKQDEAKKNLEEFWGEELKNTIPDKKVPVTELRVLTPTNITLKGDVLSYILRQGDIVIAIYNGERSLGHFSPSNIERMIQELQAALEIHNNIFAGEEACEI